MTVHTVVFDAGLTLLGVKPSWLEVFVAGAAAAGLVVDLPDEPDPGLFDVWRQHDEAWRAAGEPSPHAGDDDAERRFWVGLYERFLAAMEVDGDRSRAAAAIHDAFLQPGVFAPFDEVDQVLDDLAARGVRTGLLSNWGRGLRDILAHEGLLDRFDSVVISGEIGVVKPDHAIFHHALDDLGVEPSPDVVYVGDDLAADVAPSLELGLTPVLVDRFDRHGDADVARVTDLRALPEVLTLPARAS